jgi:hypothetical protein
MADGVSSFPPYPNPKIEETQVDGFPVVVAEIPAIGPGESSRSHLRVIGAEGTPVAGHPLIYSDTYSRGNRTICYARHSVGQKVFLQRLEEFLTGAIAVDFGELRNQSTRCVLQTQDGMRTLDGLPYQAAIDAMKREPLIFARLNFPFGDMTVDFREDADIVNDEFRFISDGTLQRSIESPVFVFDATKAIDDVWTPFLASIHWARDRVKPDVLLRVLMLGTRVPQL